MGWIDYGGCLAVNPDGAERCWGETSTYVGTPHTSVRRTGYGCSKPSERNHVDWEPPHPRARFDTWGRGHQPELVEGWGYIVDSGHDDVYVRGQWWPFESDYVRLSPDVALYAWRNEYVMVGRSHTNPDHAEFLLTLTCREQGQGSIIVSFRVDLDMTTGRWTHSPDDLTDELRDQLVEKAGKVHELLCRERARATTPPFPPGPITARDLHCEREAKEKAEQDGALF
jgi:hypothetical protein